MATWAWILIAVAIAVVVASLVMLALRERRTTRLRRRFGAEYERTLQDRDNRRMAEADLRNRQKQRKRLDIRPLAEPARTRFVNDWRQLQGQFVDQPATTVVAADGLVYRVMSERGYPVENFEEQAKLISVDHPSVVENYRFAHRICEQARSEQADTEDLRTALLRYRSLFDDLLRPDQVATGRGSEPSAGWAADPSAEPRHAADTGDYRQQVTQQRRR
jgi:transposase InsO family protein